MEYPEASTAARGGWRPPPEHVVSERYASIRDAAEHFGVAEDFVYDIAGEMNLASRRAFKAGGKWRIGLADMEDYLIERTKERRVDRRTGRRTVSDPSATKVTSAKIARSW
jgi:hypothetical protein